MDILGFTRPRSIDHGIAAGCILAAAFGLVQTATADSGKPPPPVVMVPAPVFPGGYWWPGAWATSPYWGMPAYPVRPRGAVPPCSPYPSCAADARHWGYAERRDWQRALRAQSSPTGVTDDAHGGPQSESPWGFQPRVPSPTPEGEIRPEYRGASQVRPEFMRRDGDAK